MKKKSKRPAVDRIEWMHVYNTDQYRLLFIGGGTAWPDSRGYTARQIPRRWRELGREYPGAPQVMIYDSWRLYL